MHALFAKIANIDFQDIRGRKNVSIDIFVSPVRINRGVLFPVASTGSTFIFKFVIG